MEDSPFRTAFKGAIAAQQAPAAPSTDGGAPSTPAVAAVAAPATPQSPPTKVSAAPAADGVDPDMPKEIASEEGKKTWKTWKQQHEAVVKEKETLASERESLKAELAKAKAEPVQNPEEIAALKTQLQELQVKLRMKDVEADPEWHNTYVRPVEALVKQAKTLVPAELQKAVERALSESDMSEQVSQLEALSDGLSPVRISQLATIVAQVANIRSAAEARKADSAALVKDYDQHMTARQQEQAKQQLAQQERAIGTHLSKFQEQHEIFKDPKVQEEVRGLLLGENTPDTLIESAHYAAIGRRAADELKTLRENNARLEAELARIAKARPSTTGAAAPAGATADTDSPRSFTGAVKAALASAR